MKAIKSDIRASNINVDAKLWKNLRKETIKEITINEKEKEEREDKKNKKNAEKMIMTELTRTKFNMENFSEQPP